MEDIDLFKNHKGLLLSHFNIRSLFNKIDTVRETFRELNFDVITFSESWLTDIIPDNIVTLNGYDLFRMDREWLENGQKKKDGGLITYVNNSIQVDGKKWQENNINSMDVECHWLELKFEHHRNIIIANLYRPPQGNVKKFMTYIESMVNKTRVNNVDIFIMGEFDIDFLVKGEETTK